MPEADLLKPDITVRSQQSILTLDKSEEPFPTQLDIAGSILSINLDEQWKEIIQSADGQPQRQNIISDPRHGHALRWLLKRLQSGEAGPHSPRLSIRAWILLRVLLIRTPLTNAARLLKEHKFIKTLKETFHWLHENFNQEQLSSYPQDSARSKSSESGRGSGSSSSDEQTTGRKHKRDGTEISLHRESDGPVVVLDTLFVAICGVVRQLENFIIDPGHVHKYAAEHMRAALKSSPEETAIMLGSSMYLVNHILQAPNRSRRRNRKTSTWASQKSLEDTVYKSCISSMIEFWSLFSQNVHGPSGDLNNVSLPRLLRSLSLTRPDQRAFMAHCMLPNLHLLHSYQEWANPNAYVDALQDSFKTLLVQHVILPFRASLDSRSSDIQHTNEYTTAFIGLLTTSIRNFLFHHTHQGTDRPRGKAPTRTNLAITCLSLLFNIASGCRRRNTPGLRRIEDSWLEALFSQILNCASVGLETSSSVQGQKDLVRLTEWMLRGVLDYKIKLRTTIIESILDQSSGLFDAEWAKGRVEWSLVSLCLLNDFNVFVNPSSIPSDEQIYSYRTPNTYLVALFSHMTQESCKMSSCMDVTYAFKLESILIPLLRAFADARDLTGFMAHWREQLTAVHERVQPLEKPRNALKKYPTIWEDDTLLRCVADLCESNLTVGQMQSVLEDARRNLESPTPSNGGLYASIVILDCVYSGCSREDTLSQLVKSAQLAFHSVARIITTKPDLIQGYQWRLWRILAVINDRWKLIDKPQALGEDGYPAAIRARDLLGLGDPNTVNDIEPDYSDRLHSFNFLLSFPTSEHVDLPDVVWRDIMVQAIERVMDLKESFCRQLRENHFRVPKSLDTDPNWTGQSYGIKSIDSLYIGCIARLIQSPKALR